MQLAAGCRVLHRTNIIAKKKSPVPSSPEDDLRDWCRVWVELSEGAISREEYDEWRYSYPGVKAKQEKQARDERRRKDKEGK